MSQGFTVGQHVVVTVPNSARPFNATIVKVVMAEGRMGGLFKVAPHFAKLDPDADVMAGDWLEPIGDEPCAVYAHPRALVTMGGAL